MTTHFTPETDPKLFRCSCQRDECDAPAPSALLLARLDLTRDFYGQPMIVRSGVRCRWYNARPEVGGEEPSEHCDGDGADIQARTSRERYALVRAALKSGFVRIGVGRDFVHLGVSVKPEFPSEVIWHYYPRPNAAPAASK